jgi:hypothetical protein
LITWGLLIAAILMMLMEYNSLLRIEPECQKYNEYTKWANEHPLPNIQLPDTIGTSTSVTVQPQNSS